MTAAPARRVLFAGGKTGGHLYPGIAVAEELAALVPGLGIAFAGAGFDLPRRECAARDWPYYTVPAAPIYQSNPLALVTGMMKNLRGVITARRLLNQLRPELAVVCGGYEGFPAALAARSYGVPLLLLEQNAVPGLTNRLLAPLAAGVVLAFPGPLAARLGRQALVTGNPVRGSLFGFRRDYGRFGLAPDKLTGLIFGGSAGAGRLNHAVIDAAPALAELNGVQFIIQTGGAERETVEQAVQTAKLNAHVTAYLDPIGAAYALADFAVARAGGGAFELAALGIPTVFVPYPFAAADHQTANARAFVRAGAAKLIADSALTGETLTAAIEELTSNETLRRRMGAAMQRLGRPAAARRAAEFARTLMRNT